MISKKEGIMLGLLAVGGVGVALALSGKEGGLGGGGGGLGLAEEPEAMTKKETVTETYAPAGLPTMEAPKGFFEMPQQIISKISPSPAAAKIGFLAPSPATGVRPYLYTGGKIAMGAYSLAPSPATGVTPHLYTGGVVKPGAFTVYKGGGGVSKPKSTFSSKSYQKGYQSRAKKRYRAARKHRLAGSK